MPNTSQYTPIYQNQLTTELFSKLVTSPKYEVGRAQQDKRNLIKPKVKIIKRPGAASVSTLLLLAAIIAEYSEKGKWNVIISLEHYCERRNANDKKFMRKQVKQALEYLNLVEFAIYESHSRAWKTIKIFNEVPVIQRGAIDVVLSPDMKKVMPRQKVMHLPNDVFHLRHGEKSATRFLAVWRICQHKRINNYDGIFTLPVKMLLDVCGNLPRYEELGPSGHVLREIIDPLSKALTNCDKIFNAEFAGQDYNCNGYGNSRPWWDLYNDNIVITVEGE